MAKKKAASKKTGRKKSGKKRKTSKKRTKKATSKKTTAKKTGKKKRRGKKRSKNTAAPASLVIGVAREAKALADKNAALQSRLNKANIAKENAEQAARMARLSAGPRKRRGKKKSSSTALAKVGKKRKSSAGLQTISAKDIINGAREKSMTAWICAGPKRTGCGGGKRGGHVIAGLSAPRRMKR